MLQVVTKSAFISAFMSIRPDNFTRDALSALYDHFEEIDPGMYLDVVAICCDYSEYSTAIEAAQELGWERSSDEDEDEDQAEKSAVEWLTGRAEIIRVENGSVVVSGYRSQSPGDETMRDNLTRQARIIVMDEIANGDRPKPKTPQEVRQAIESVRGWLFIRQEARDWSREWNGLRHE